MRIVADSNGKPLKLTDKLRGKLRTELKEDHDKAISGRQYIDQTWRTCLRMYQGNPAQNRWIPFENAPFIEVTIGAENCDSVVAQMQDLIFQVARPLTVRCRKAEFDKAAEVAQKYADWGVESGKWCWRPSTKTWTNDVAQMGTAVYYIPWIERVRKTDLYKITDFGPEIQCIAPENLIVPTNATNVQTCKFATIRDKMDKYTARIRGANEGWTIDDENSVGPENDVTKDRRKLSGVNDDSANTKELNIGYTWGLYDVDDDGIQESVYIVWNMISGNVLKLSWYQYDCRPFVVGVYQERSHVFYGLGVLEMDASYEQEITEIRNNRVWNMMMRNMACFKGPEQAMPEVKVLYPGKYFSTDAGDIEPMAMGEADNAPVQAEMIAMSNAKNRVGVNELNATSRLGGRTPGITALSALQQANRRFTTPFDNARIANAGAVMHCFYRTQEQVRAGNRKVVAQLKKILGDADAGILIDLFKRSDVELHDALDIQLTASSVSINREADRQNMVMLSTIYEKYMQMVAMLAQVKANPPFHGADKEAEAASKNLNKVMLRILQTFDQVSDVESYLLTLDDVPEGQPMPPQLAEMMGGANNPNAQGQLPQNGGPPIQ